MNPFSEIKEINLQRANEIGNKTKGFEKIINGIGGMVESDNKSGFTNEEIQNVKDISKDVSTVKDNMEKMREKTDETDDSRESDIEKKDSSLARIEASIATPEGIKDLVEKHPEKAELWKSQLDALEILNDPEASPAEIRSAQAKLSNLKGQLMETAVKDELMDAGFDVEMRQRVVEGENGGTRPDVIAENNTDHPIKIFNVTIQSGETLSVECKCGGLSYMTSQLNNHIPNQLSGQEGIKALLATSDIKEVPDGLPSSVCEKYGANLVVADVSVADVEKAIKEVAKS